MHTHVYITVDTESSIAGAWSSSDRYPLPAARHVFCENDQGKWGLSLIVDELNKYGMKGTFFCEMLATPVLGEEDTRSITDFLLNQGQDVQLHLHPTFHHYHEYRTAKRDGRELKDVFKCDLLSLHSEDQQLALLEEACDLFRKYTGSSPFAFRSGNFSADRRTLRILKKMNIAIDSSFEPNNRFVHSSFKDDPPLFNRVQKIEEIWEFPITVARTWSWRGPAYKPFTISAISNIEMERILNCAFTHGMEHVIVVFHCFSTVKAKDSSYTIFKPNKIVIQRLKRLLFFLDKYSSRFMVKTFGDLKNNLDQLEIKQHAVVPRLGLWHSATRKVVQGLNNFYWF